MIEFGFADNNIEYIQNFIDTDRFRYNPGDKAYALFIGRLSAEKGVELLLEACRMVPEIPVIIAGTGPREDELKNSPLITNWKMLHLSALKAVMTCETDSRSIVYHTPLTGV